MAKAETPSSGTDVDHQKDLSSHHSDDSMATVSPMAPSSSAPPVSAKERTQFLTALRVQQSEACHRGQGVLAETYREKYPALREDIEAFQELIANEIAGREATGEHPGLAEYLERFPEMESWLRQRFEVSEADGSSQALTAPPTPNASPDRDPDGSMLTVAPSPGASGGAGKSNSPTDDGATLSLPRDSKPGPKGKGVATEPRGGWNAAKPPKGDSSRASVPGYEIVGELGRGGMGVVYKARHVALNRFVALKMILGGQHVGLDELARFRTEAEAVARIKHPNIVQVYDIGTTDGRPYFSLEFVDGGTLDKKMGGTPLTDLQAAELIEILARAVHSAHQAGIIHRDLKPANILLQKTHPGRSTMADPAHASQSSARSITADFTPKITDFGLAKRLEVEDGHTRTGAIMGTPSYMAPEQASGTAGVGPPADIYALGAILYEMLTGHPSFKGSTVWDTLEQVRLREPVPPTRLQPKVSPDLETICLKCLEKAPERRYATAEDLADDLRRFQNHEPILARRATLLERAVKWAKRRPKEARLVALSASLLLTLIVGFIGYHIYLEFALKEARAQVVAAKERERLEAVQKEAQDYLSRGQAAFQANDWATANLHINNAKARLGADPGLGELRGRIEALAADVNRYERFASAHDDALFHATLFTGLDTAANLQKTREAAQQALDLFAVRLDSDTPPAVEGSQFTDAQKAAILENCYELLLVLADATAYTLPDDSPEKRKARAAQALPILDRAAKLGLETQAYHLRRARYLAQQGEAGQATAERENAQKRKPTTALDLFLVGEDATKRGDFAGAQRDFERALDQMPSHYWAQYYHAVCSLRLQHPGEAVTGLTACISRRPDFAWSYLMRGLAHGELGRNAADTDAAGEFALAELDFQRVLDKKPDPVTLYGLYANRGVMRIRQQKLPEAIADLRQAIAIKPAAYQAYVNLAQAFQTQKQYTEAVAELTKAIERDPHQPAIYRFRALLHTELKDADAALKDYEEAIKNEPPGARSLALAEDHVARGKIYQKKKQHQKAVAAFDDALRIRPELAQAHRLRAESLLLLNRIDEAVLALDLCLQTEKPTAEVYRARAQAKAKLGRLPDAIDDYTRALDLEPEPIGYSQRGWSYLLVYEAPKLAIRDFESAIRLDDKHADAYNGRGTCRVLLGMLPQAVADAEEAVQRAGNTPRLIYKSARIYALAVAKMDPDTLKGDRKALEQRSQWLERALALLNQTFQLLPAEQRPAFWKELVETDPAMTTLRRTPGYASLMKEYGRPAK